MDNASRDQSQTHNARTAVEPLAHTPGPWSSKRAKFPTDGAWDFAVGPAGGERMQIIAETFGYCSEGDLPAEANARLIAAAPDLLEAAQTVLAGLLARIDAARDSTPVFAGIAALHAAIAKAVGTSAPADSEASSGQTPGGRNV